MHMLQYSIELTQWQTASYMYYQLLILIITNFRVDDFHYTNRNLFPLVILQHKAPPGDRYKAGRE